MHTCVHAGLHAYTPLLMCKQQSTHKHTLACVRTWRGLIIMIVHHDDMQIMCVCSCICTVAHGYSQLYEGLKVHRPAHTCICAPARTFHGTNKLATTELQLYPAVISPSVFATLSGYTCWPSAVIPNGYNRYLFFYVKLAVITALGPASVIQRLYPTVITVTCFLWSTRSRLDHERL